MDKDILLTSCDDKLALLLPDLKTFQDNFAKPNHGKYWQGLPTHTEIPKDGVEAKPNNIKTPTDQPTEYPDFIKQADLPMSLQIDVYDSPKGKGYQIVMTTQINDEKYRKVINIGPEEHRNKDWKIVEEVNLGNNN